MRFSKQELDVMIGLFIRWWNKKLADYSKFKNFKHKVTRFFFSIFVGGRL